MCDDEDSQLNDQWSSNSTTVAAAAATTPTVTAASSIINYICCRTENFNPDKWKSELPLENIRKVEEQCKLAMAKLNYTRFEPEHVERQEGEEET